METDTNPTRGRITVVLVDDHAVVRAGLKMLLDATDDIHVVGDADNVDEALELNRALSPNVVVLDLQLGEASGLEFLDRLGPETMAAKVVVLTMHEADEYLFEALRLGAAGYVLKRSADVDLITAIRAVAAGDSFVDSAVTAALVARARFGASDERQRANVYAESVLSERELQVAQMVALGHTNAEVGKELHLSVKTVETYRSRAMVKLNLESRAQLVRYALDADWLTASDAND